MMDLIYVLSPGHSGSTVLGLLLGAHPRIATAGELKMVPWSYRSGEKCSCGAVMDQCAFWQEIARRLRERGFDLGSDDFATHVSARRTFVERLIATQVRGTLGEAARSLFLSAWPPARGRLSHTLACNAALIEAIYEVSGRSVFLDTSKDASRLRYLSDSGRFAIRVLHLVRDGRAVAFSMIKKGLSPRDAARYWVREHEQARRLRARIGSRVGWMEIHYESFCEDPDGNLAAVCEFVGIPPDERRLDFRGWESHILGNRMRLTSGGEITLDTSWQSKLEGASRQVVSAITEPLNRSYGYV